MFQIVETLLKLDDSPAGCSYCYDFASWNIWILRQMRGEMKNDKHSIRLKCWGFEANAQGAGGLVLLFALGILYAIGRSLLLW